MNYSNVQINGDVFNIGSINNINGSFNNVQMGMQDSIVGNGNIVKNEISLNNYSFNEINNYGSLKVIVKQDSNESIIIEGESNIIENIVINNNNNILDISIKQGCSFSTQYGITIYVSTNNIIDSLKGVGSGTMILNDIYNLKETSISLNGSGDMILEGTKIIENLSCSLNGSGDISISDTIKTNYANLVLNGSGDITIKNVESVDITFNGSGDITIGKETNINIENKNGSGDINKI